MNTHPNDRRDFLKASAGAAAMIALSDFLPAAQPAQGSGLRVGLVGCGRQGRAILGELAKIEGLKIAALCDTLESRLNSARRRVGEVPAYASHTELLDKAKDVDAIIVATPSHLHRAVILDALAAGRHVYGESPLATTLEDARAIVKAARGAKSVFHTGMYGRSNPIYRLAHSFVRSGAIREIVSGRAQWNKKTSLRATGSHPEEEKALNWMLDPAVSLGLCGEFGTHSFDVTLWFFNQNPIRVRAGGSLQFHKDGREVHDTVCCELEYPGGQRFAFSATLANSLDGAFELFQGNMGSVKLAGNAGWLFKEADAPTQGWEVYANRQQFHEEQGITLIADATKLAKLGKLKDGVGLPNPPLYYALADFVKSVTESKPVVCTAEDGLRAALIAMRVAQAMKQDGSVAIGPEEFEVG
jgi:predicted dehydrogenase